MVMKLALQWTTRLKLRAEGDKLWAEGDKLRAEGDKLWVEAIIKSYGNITLEWKWRGSVLDCALENGDVYRGDEEIAAPQAPSGEGGE